MHSCCMATILHKVVAEKKNEFQMHLIETRLSSCPQKIFSLLYLILQMFLKQSRAELGNKTIVDVTI